MKKSMFTIAIVAIAIGATTIGCANTNEKVADANEKVADAKDDVIEAKDDLVKAKDDAARSAAKAATVEEWKLFKIESETKIQNNDAEIARLKMSFKKPGKELDAMYAESIRILELKNKDLKAKVDNYQTSQSDWSTFRREFDYDMESLGKSIKNFGTDNRK